MATASSSREETSSNADERSMAARSSSRRPEEAAAESRQAVSSRSVGSHRVEMSLASCLAPWLDSFTSCTAHWGLLTDVRDDGTTYQRHGIVVDLTANVSISTRDKTHALWRLRHAVDLVKLALAVDPSVITPLLAYNSCLKSEEIRSLAGRNVPFTAQLELEVKVKTTAHVTHILANRFMKEFDEDPVDESDALRRYLVDQVLRSGSSRRLMQLPVETTVEFKRNNTKEPLHPSFFTCVALTSKTFDEYQRQRRKEWDMANLFAPLVIDSIYLQLDTVPFQSSLLKAASAFKDSGIPVCCSSLTLDFQTIACEEEELRMFLDAVHTSWLSITTATDRYTVPARHIDDKDVSDKILAILRCIGQLPCALSLDLTGLIALFQSTVNRPAIFRGLVNFILPRESSVQLSFLDAADFNHVDADDLSEEVNSWRRAHPHQKLRLESLEMDVEEWSSVFITALLRSLDDVEDVSLSLRMDDMIDDEDLKCVLRYPSLRNLSVRNVRISTMDIFTSDDLKLHLESLELCGLALLDSSSLVNFVKSLNPLDPCSSSLSTTLQKLSIVETDEDDEGDEENRVRLAITDTSAVEALDEVLAANTVLQKVHFIGDFDNIPVMPAYGSPTKTSYIPASVAMKQGALVKAQMAAFLSGLGDGNSTAANGFDSNIVRLIFGFNFSAPKILREIHV